MKRAVIILALFAEAACQRDDSLDNANRRYQFMIANRAPHADLCREARENARAAAHALDQPAYRMWLEQEGEECVAK